MKILRDQEEEERQKSFKMQEQIAAQKAEVAARNAQREREIMERILAEELAREEAQIAIKNVVHANKKEVAMRRAEEEAKIQERILAEEFISEDPGEKKY